MSIGNVKRGDVMFRFFRKRILEKRIADLETIVQSQQVDIHILREALDNMGIKNWNELRNQASRKQF